MNHLRLWHVNSWECSQQSERPEEGTLSQPRDSTHYRSRMTSGEVATVSAASQCLRGMKGHLGEDKPVRVADVIL